MLPAMIAAPRHFLGWFGQRFPFPWGPRPWKPGSSSTIAGSARPRTSRRSTAMHQLF